MSNTNYYQAYNIRIDRLARMPRTTRVKVQGQLVKARNLKGDETDGERIDLLVDLWAYLRPGGLNPLEVVFELEGGPTGYESFYVTDNTVDMFIRGGWLACLGTQNRWDRLYITGEAMKLAFEQLGILEARNATTNETISNH